MESLYYNNTTFLSNFEINYSPYFIAFSSSKFKSNINKDNLEREFNFENLIFNKSKLECVNKLKDTKENSSNMISIIQPEKNQN